MRALAIAEFLPTHVAPAPPSPRRRPELPAPWANEVVGEAEANDLFMQASRTRAAASGVWAEALQLALTDDLAWCLEEAAWRAHRHALNLWRLASDLRDSRFGRVRHQARRKMLISV